LRPEISKYLAPLFAIIGSGERLSIMIILHGSEYVLHQRDKINVDDLDGCLTLRQISEITGIEPSSRLLYHIKKLISVNWVRKIPYADSNGNVYALYGITNNWVDFASEYGIDIKIKEYVNEKRPELLDQIEKH